MNQSPNRHNSPPTAGDPRQSPQREGVAGSRQPLEIAVYLYPGMAASDAICPYDILSGIPGATIRFVAKERGLVWMDSRMLSLQADYAIDEIESADILLLPGGAATSAQMQDEKLLAWVRRIHEQSRWTTSVCSGSLILAAAGLLNGLEATSHWAALETLAMFGAKPTSRRVIRQGKIVTAAGVSAGIDMALSLVGLECGEEFAKVIQLFIEYDPQPPFEGGSIEKASPATINQAKALVEKYIGRLS